MLPQPAQLRHHVLHKALSAEARLHRHHQHQLHVPDIGAHGLGRRAGLDHHARALSGGMDRVDGGVEVLLRVRLHMHRHKVRPRLAELADVPPRLDDHQMHVQRQRRDGPDGLDHRDADGDVGDEHSVHHVHMDVIGG